MYLVLSLLAASLHSHGYAIGDKVTHLDHSPYRLLPCVIDGIEEVGDAPELYVLECKEPPSGMPGDDGIRYYASADQLDQAKQAVKNGLPSHEEEMKATIKKVQKDRLDALKNIKEFFRN